MSAYRVTVRNGPHVARESYDELEDAIAALERGAKEIRAAGPLPARKLLRDYEPEGQVAGRVEISTGGILRRGLEAGVDVMGDGAFVPYKGGIRRIELDPGDRGPFHAVREVFT